MPEPGDIITAYPSEARTATPADVDIESEGAYGAVVVIDVTAVAATPSVVFNVRGYDPVSDQTWLILASAAVTGTGQTILKIAPALTAAANTIASDLIPPVLRVDPVHADADSITYSVTVHLT